MTKLLLEQYPIIRILRIGVGRANAFSILNSSADANFCTVEITATVIRLIVDGGANADDTSLTLADYASIDLLITAIEALAKGWSCSTLATDTATRDGDQILIRPSMHVGTAKSAYIEVSDDFMTEYRVVSPAESRNYGLIQASGVFMPNMEYFISYVAGYTTIPYALEMVCIEFVKYKYDKSQKDFGVKSEKIGNVYAYENFSPGDLEAFLGLNPEIKAELDLFRKREF